VKVVRNHDDELGVEQENEQRKREEEKSGQTWTIDEDGGRHIQLPSYRIGSGIDWKWKRSLGAERRSIAWTGEFASSLTHELLVARIMRAIATWTGPTRANGRSMVDGRFAMNNDNSTGGVTICLFIVRLHTFQ